MACDGTTQQNLKAPASPALGLRAALTRH